MMEFDRTILVKVAGIWQAAEAHVILSDDGQNKDIWFKLNGRVFWLPKETRYQLYNDLLLEEEKTAFVIERNLEDLNYVIAMEKKKYFDDAERRLRQYRVNQMMLDQEVRDRMLHNDQIRPPANP